MKGVPFWSKVVRVWNSGWSIPEHHCFDLRLSELLNSGSPESGPKFAVDPRSADFSKSTNPLNLSSIHSLFGGKSVDPQTYSHPSVL